MYKYCIKCKINKDILEFDKNKRTLDGYHYYCKLCRKPISKKTYSDNKSNILESVKTYQINNKNTIAEYQKEYRKNHKSQRREYDNNNKEKLKKQHSDYANKRYTDDLNYKIKHNLRTRIGAVIHGKNKSNNTLTLLGCSIEEFKIHLESKFDQNMSWENYGKYWHIDHIKPCAMFNLIDENQQKECFHFSNLQPLEAKENISKRDRYIG